MVMNEVVYNYEAETDVCVVLTTCPDKTVAARLAQALVEDGLAACVTRIPGATSVYRWQGGVEEDAEVQLVIKTGRGRVAALYQSLRALHPDEEPECLVLETGGSRSFLNWIVEETSEAAS